MVAVLSDFGRELGRLVTRTGRTWWRLLAALMAAMLVGWLGYYASVLLGSILVMVTPWLAVPSIAFGVVVQLAAMVVAMRLAGAEAGVATVAAKLAPPRAADRSAPIAPEPIVPVGPLPGATEVVTAKRVDIDVSLPERGETIAQILGATLLPFLCIYSAFGFVDVYANNLLAMVSARASVFQMADVVGNLNPTQSLKVAVIVLGVIVALYTIRHGLDVLTERRGTNWIPLLSAFLEATMVALTLLTGVRFAAWTYMKWAQRRGYGWWHSSLAAVKSVVHIDIPQILSTFVHTVWPVLWQALTQPLVWLALTCLVAGARLTSMDDLLDRIGERRGLDNTAPAGRGRAVSRQLGFHLRETILGDINDKVLPAVYSLRLIWRAGPVFLGAFIVVYTATNLASDLLTRAIQVLFRHQSTTFWLTALTFVELIPRVLVLGFQMVLLSVAFVRVDELAQDRAARLTSPNRPSTWLGGVAVAAAVALVATGSYEIQNNPFESVDHVGPGQVQAFATTRVSADNLRLAKTVTYHFTDTTTTLVFVAVDVGLECVAQCNTISVELTAGIHTYQPWDGDPYVHAPNPGFVLHKDVIFEVIPDDLADGFVTLTLKDSQGFVPFNQMAIVRLPVSQQATAGAPTTTIDSDATETTEVPR